VSLCSRCSELPSATILKPPRVERTTAPGRIRCFPGVIEECNETHTIDVGHVLLEYLLESPVECSFPGRHAHMNGVIVRTRCGLVLRIGHRCADRFVRGWDEVRRHNRAVAQRQDRISAVLDSAGYEERLTECSRVVNQRISDQLDTYEIEASRRENSRHMANKRLFELICEIAEAHIGARTLGEFRRAIVKGSEPSAAELVRAARDASRLRTRVFELENEVRPKAEGQALEMSEDPRASKIFREESRRP
jgi:hypothetical protein